MPRWVWFMPLAALSAALGVWAFRMGWIAATLTETDVILAYADLYLETHQGPAFATDCSARPDELEQVWLVVTCIAQDGARYDYPVDRFGRLLEVAANPRRPEAPNT
ncbi:MAG: hypothetical protein V2I76_14565 [Roseobacter sp.]|jgi:hypothetical protein|nr:hypothetical protein [Roseobacter sp.]